MMPVGFITSHCFSWYAVLHVRAQSFTRVCVCVSVCVCVCECVCVSVCVLLDEYLPLLVHAVSYEKINLSYSSISFPHFSLPPSLSPSLSHPPYPPSLSPSLPLSVSAYTSLPVDCPLALLHTRTHTHTPFQTDSNELFKWHCHSCLSPHQHISLDTSVLLCLFPPHLRGRPGFSAPRVPFWNLGRRSKMLNQLQPACAKRALFPLWAALARCQ